MEGDARDPKRGVTILKTEYAADYWQRRQKLIAFLSKDLGTTEIAVARTYMEDSLRLVLHLIMSQPEYQLD